MNRYLKTIAKIAISVGLIVVLLTQIDVVAIGRELLDANPFWAAATFVLFALSIILRAFRWQILLNARELLVPFRLLTEWYYIGAFFNTLLPTGFGGDVVKTVYLAQYTHQTPAAVGTVILDRFLGILVLLALGVLAIPLSQGDLNPLISISLLSIFVAAAGGFWLLRQHWLVRWFRKTIFLRFPVRVQTAFEGMTWIKPLYDALQGYDRITLAKALAASLVFNLVWILINVTAGLALGVEASLVDYMVFVPLVSLALLLPSFGGIGVRELSYVGLFSQIGVAPETAFAMSILIYAATVATGLLGGAILLWRNIQSARKPVPPDTPAPLSNTLSVSDES